jgi:hypothetical protein
LLLRLKKIAAGGARCACAAPACRTPKCAVSSNAPLERVNDQEISRLELSGCAVE